MNIPFFDSIDRPTKCRLLIAFTDITGFTKEFTSRSDQELFDLMSQFYERMGDAVESSGGKIVKFIGDGVLLVYPGEEAKCGVEALRNLKTLLDEWLRANHFRGELHVRAHLGPVICGPLGTRSEKRFDVLGIHVNTTALLKCDGFTLSPELEQDLQS
jgi:adenylate cyclase